MIIGLANKTLKLAIVQRNWCFCWHQHKQPLYIQSNIWHILYFVKDIHFYGVHQIGDAICLEFEIVFFYIIIVVSFKYNFILKSSCIWISVLSIPLYILYWVTLTPNLFFFVDPDVLFQIFWSVFKRTHLPINRLPTTHSRRLASTRQYPLRKKRLEHTHTHKHPSRTHTPTASSLSVAHHQWRSHRSTPFAWPNISLACDMAACYMICVFKDSWGYAMCGPPEIATSFDARVNVASGYMLSCVHGRQTRHSPQIHYSLAISAGTDPICI